MLPCHKVEATKIGLPHYGEPVSVSATEFLELPRFVVYALGNLSGCLSLSCEFVRRQVAE